MAPNVLVVGNLILDEVWSVRGRLRVGAKHGVDRVDAYGGGQAANVAATLAGLGLGARLVAAAGEDGDWALRELSERGVDTAFVVVLPHEVTQKSVVVVAEDGERTILTLRPQPMRLTAPPAAAAWDDVIAVFTDGHEPVATREICRSAAGRGLPVIADCEDAGGVVCECLSDVRILLAPAGVLLELGGHRALREAMKRIRRMGPEIVVGTLGGDGSLVADAQGFCGVAAQRCSAVDTTGAGDAFHAAFVTCWLAGWPPRGAARFAARVAAAKCEVKGPRLDAQRLRELRAHLARRETSGAGPEAEPSYFDSDGRNSASSACTEVQ